jgi:hypothetical protein
MIPSSLHEPLLVALSSGSDMSFTSRDVTGDFRLTAATRCTTRRVALSLQFPQGLKRLLVVINRLILSGTGSKRQTSHHRAYDRQANDHQHDAHLAYTSR